MFSQNKDTLTIYENYKRLFLESTSIVPVRDGHVLLSDYVKKHIQAHNKPGVGSVFKSDIDLKNLESIIQNIDITGDGGVYTVKYPEVGYNLVLPIEDARNLPDAQEAQVYKDERGKRITVPAIKTSSSIEEFATDQLTIIIRPSNVNYLPDDVKTQEILDAIDQGKSYSVLTAFPGDPNIPHASEWNGQYAVILPNNKIMNNDNENIYESYRRRIHLPDVLGLGKPPKELNFKPPASPKKILSPHQRNKDWEEKEAAENDRFAQMHGYHNYEHYNSGLPPGAIWPPRKNGPFSGEQSFAGKPAGDENAENARKDPAQARDEAYINQHFDSIEDPSKQQVPAVIKYYQSKYGKQKWYNDIADFYAAAELSDPEDPLADINPYLFPDMVNGVKIYPHNWKQEHFQAVIDAMG